MNEQEQFKFCNVLTEMFNFFPDKLTKSSLRNLKMDYEVLNRELPNQSAFFYADVIMNIENLKDFKTFK